MKLTDWLKLQGLSNDEFAAMIDTTATSVYRYAEGLRIPNEETMGKIYTATKGAVTPNDFYRIPLLQHLTSTNEGSAA